MWTGSGSGSNSSSTIASLPARFAASILYDITRARPAPSIAARTAASDVLTHSLELMGATFARLPRTNLHAEGVACSSMVMQWCLDRSSSCFGRPALLQVGRARANDDADRADPGRDHAAVRQRPHADRDIDVLFGHVDHAIGQHEPQGNIRVGFEKLDGQRAADACVRGPKVELAISS